MNNEEIIDLENATVFPEFYPAINHAMQPLQAIDFIRDLVYFKVKTLINANANEIVDVL